MKLIVVLVLLANVAGCGVEAGEPAAAPSPAPPLPAGEPMSARTDVASYDLVARWEPETNQIHGRGVITYQNPSTDTLSEVWLKLYLNAFRNADTPWMQEGASDPRSADFDPDHPGWITLEQLQLADTGEDVLPPDAATADTSLRVPLPAARSIEPGERIRIAVQWTSQLPRVFARTGVAGDFVMAGQWYPKLAVYDRGVWDSEPWHANSEFFGDFGTYTLELTVPAGYVTGGTGERDQAVTHADGTVTVRYHADSVSDFAWTAWPGYRQATRAVDAAGRSVELELLAPRSLPTAVDARYFNAAQVALDRYGRWFGAYPWSKLTLVVPPADAPGAGGMEYPTFVTLDLPTDLPFGLGRGIHDLEIVTVHEIAHQWVPMQLATNEGREAWLDEGFADYASIRVLRVMFEPAGTLAEIGPFRLSYETLHRSQYVTTSAHEPLDYPSWQYPDYVVYGATVYSKGMLTLQTLERHFGEERFLIAFRGYFNRWRWRHPMAPDLQRALEDGTGEPLDWFFQPVVYGTDVAEYAVTSVAADGGTVERRGEMEFPVDVALTYADGRVERQRWGGADPQLAVRAGGGALAEIVVDPDHVIKIEPDYLDDGQTAGTQVGTLGALGARLLALLQAMLVVLGTLG